MSSMSPFQGFHLNPISGQSVQSVRVPAVHPKHQTASDFGFFFKAVTHHPKLLVKLRTECEEKLSDPQPRRHISPTWQRSS